MSQPSEPGPIPQTPSDALERLYYVHDGAGVIGPITGVKLKEMIESGAVPRAAHVNLVGAPNWVPVMEFQPFVGFFKEGSTEPSFAAPRPDVACSGAQRYASFWTRLGAYLIDYVLTALVYIVVLFAFGFVGALLYGADLSRTYFEEHQVFINGLGAIIGMAYYIHFTSGIWQATPGKRILGIYIIRTNGERITPIFGFLRYISYIISALPLFFGFLMIFWTKERQGLHDMVCETRVVHGKL